MENWFEDINQDAEIRTIDVELILFLGQTLQGFAYVLNQLPHLEVLQLNGKLVFLPKLNGLHRLHFLNQ
jgi:hypothetical protein